MKRGFIRYSRYRQIKRDWKGNRDWIEEQRMEMVLQIGNRCIKRIEGDKMIMEQKMENRDSWEEVGKG